MATEATETHEGPVLEVLPKLLAEGRIDEALEVVRALVARNEQLERELAGAGRTRMKANEGVNHNQLLLVLGALQARQEQGQPQGELGSEDQDEQDELLRARAAAAAERARLKVLAQNARPKRKPLNKPLPPELERRDNVIEVPPRERACPRCGEERVVFAHDVSEVVELIPAKVYARRDLREKRKCRRCDSPPVRAPRGTKPVTGGQLGCSVLAQIVVDKYDMGLPLHRQRKSFERLGLKLSSSTLCDQIRWAAELLRPLWHEAFDQVLGARVMHIDGSGLDVLDRDHPKGKRRGALWTLAGASSTTPEVAAYASTKKAKGQRFGERGPHNILAQREGLVVSDADSLFNRPFKRDDLIDCGCNMHARRYFAKALDGGDERAALMLGAFKMLYQIEDEVRETGDAERLAARQEHSTPCYDDMMT